MLKVVIIGQAKTGKSSLAWAVRDMLLRAGIGAVYVDPDTGTQSPKLHPPLGDTLRGPVEIQTVQAQREPCQALVSELVGLVRDLGEDSDDLLDDLVIDVKSAEASDINNDGVEDQVRYLLKNGVGEREIRNAIGSVE